MYAALTVRKLKPGSYEAWRKAWEPDEWPSSFTEAYILRNVNDPDEIIAFGLAEGTESELRAQGDRFKDQEEKRQQRMEQHVASTGADGFYEVVEVVKPTVAARH